MPEELFSEIAPAHLAALDEIAARWTAAATPLDPAALGALYTPDAVFFGGLPDHYVGRSGVERYFDFYRDMLASIAVRFSDMHCAGLGLGLVCQGFADFTFGLVDGRTTFNRLRATLVLERGQDGWAIKLHHFSPPPEDTPVPR
jgi:ketosteroid isomerase-like protein